MAQGSLSQQGLLNHNVSYADLVSKNPNLVEVNICYSFRCAGTKDTGKIVLLNEHGKCRACRGMTVTRTMQRKRLTEIKKRETFLCDMEKINFDYIALKLTAKEKFHKEIELCKANDYYGDLSRIKTEYRKSNRKEKAIETNKESCEQVADI